MDDDWFHAEDGKVVGPISFDDAARLISAAPGAPHLVWRKGMEQWVDARMLPVFAPAFATAPPPLPPAAGVAVPALPGAAGAGNHPWRRYFARIFDVYLFMLFGGFSLGFLAPSLFDGDGQSSRGTDQLLGLIGLAAYVPVEAIMLSAFGGTPGRALYGIRLLPTRGTLTFGAALNRSAAVWLKGMGLGIPIVSLITAITAYKKLKESGTTSWDASQGWTVSHAQLGTGRWIAIVVTWIVLTAIAGVLIEIGRLAQSSP